MWKLSIEDDQGQATIVQLVRGDYSIGRTEDNTIRLTERNISRHHARLIKEGDSWCFEDLGSYNGCYINGARVVGRQPISPSDLIQLGDYRLELVADDATTTSSPQASSLATTQASGHRRSDTLSTTMSASAQSDRLVMIVGPTPGREYHLTRAPQRIGRGEDCDICVNHASVSRWHADLNFIGAGCYEIVDHGSANSIRINGVELARGLIDNRDLIELGDVVLKFIPAGQVYRPTPEESRQLAALLGVDVDGPPPSRVERLRVVWTSMSRGTRFGAVLLGLIVTVLFAFVVAARQRPAVLALRPSAVQPTSEERTLSEATKQLKSGDVDEAHRLLLTIADSPGLRDTSAFRQIESQWAQTMLSRAAQSESPEARRKLLELVARSTTVESSVQKDAAEQLARLQRDEMDAAAAATADQVARAAAEPTAAAGGEPTPEAPVEPAEAKQPVVEATQPASAETSSGTATRSSLASAARSQKASGASSGWSSSKATVSQSASTQGATSQKTTTRPMASEPSATELATSGNLDSARTARDALKRKVNAGSATDRDKRLLRALCRQLGDASCSR